MAILVLHGHHHNPNGCPLSILGSEWGEWHTKHCGGVALGVCKWTPENPNIL